MIYTFEIDFIQHVDQTQSLKLRLRDLELGFSGFFFFLSLGYTRIFPPLDNGWGNILCSQIGSFNIVKMSSPPNLIYRFNVIPLKIPASHFVNTEKLILAFI